MIPYCILILESDDDRKFMSSLYINYQRLMYSVIGKIIKNNQDVEDVMQTVLERLIDKISLLRSRNQDQLANYIISACKFTAYNYLRDNKNQRLEDSYYEYAALPDETQSGHEIELRMIKGEELETLRRILLQMEPRAQYLLKGYYFLEKSMEELGAELNIKPSSVRMSLTRARRQAFELLQKELGTDRAEYVSPS